VLIVDDDPATVRSLRDHLGLFRHDHDYQVETTSDGAEGLAEIRRRRLCLRSQAVRLRAPRAADLDGPFSRRAAAPVA